MRSRPGQFLKQLARSRSTDPDRNKPEFKAQNHLRNWVQISDSGPIAQETVISPGNSNFLQQDFGAQGRALGPTRVSAGECFGARGRSFEKLTLKVLRGRVPDVTRTPLKGRRLRVSGRRVRSLER